MKHKVILIFIILFSLFLRTHRIPDFLGFWYDQGRDAKVIWDLWHKGDFFFVGPTTGIEGIFLGPFYYYFIAPFYLASGGDPVLPALWLGLVSTLAIIVTYLIAREYFSAPIALLATLLSGLSYSMVTYSRWLSNPTPLPLFSLLAFWIILKIIHGGKNKLLWPLLGLILGLSLQLEAASAIFFLPATFIVLFINRKSSIINQKLVVTALIFFGLTLLPQLAFNFKNNNLILKAFIRFLVSEKSFQTSFTTLLDQRLSAYFNYFFSKLSFADEFKPLFAAGSTILAVVALASRQLPTRLTLTLLIWIALPLSVLLFYHGNNGYVWDYYFIGVYPQFFLLLAVIWSAASRSYVWAKLVTCFLLTLFLYQNTYEHLAFLSRKVAGYVALAPIIQAVDWVYEDAGPTPFNTDVYVPPVIPHAYDYIFLWRGTTKYHTLPHSQLQTRLYTLLEPDPGHAQLRDKWLIRQSHIGSIETELEFGPLLVQRRHRFSTTADQ
jgi:4-amino-4-deoxy-L-arabinose transferase-like glycosyltransferase